MPEVFLDTTKINNWDDFHTRFKDMMGFPDFYGMNGDAWIDCMSNLRDDTKMSKVLLRKDEVLIIKVSETMDFANREPEIFEGLLDYVSFVNKKRFVDEGLPPAITLMFL